MKRKNLLIPNVSTLVQLLGERASCQPEKVAYTFLLNGEQDEITLTYEELACQARAIAASLQQHTAAGERALLLYPPSLHFVAAFFGCLYAGVVAVPAYPPHRKRSMPRLKAIMADAQATVVLTTREILSQVESLLALDPSLAAVRWLATDGIDEELASEWQAPTLDSDSLAFLQYTSGSTGTPKGVMVTHGNLLHNERMIEQMFGHSEQTLFVGWLPLFHDMGLIGNVLQPLYLGIPCVLMSPLAFLQKPLRWLQAISRYGQLDGGKLVTSGGPNFAYDLCAYKSTPEERAKLDLSRWRIAFNGSEPVRAETMERFAAAFAVAGFRKEAFYPCYGLAEGTLLVSGGVQSALPIVKHVQGSALEENRIVAASPQEEGAHSLVGSGRSSVEQQIVIVNPQTLTACPADEIGEVWVAGGSVAHGYWRRAEKTKETFGAYLNGTNEGPFLRTGDLGFMQEGELFITGRMKDLIIIRGRNHYPQDIELTVERTHPALRLGCGAAFSVEIEGEERLMVAQEIKRTHLRQITEHVDEIVAAIRRAVSEAHELQVYGVLLLKTGRLPKTSSGKIQRHACRVGFLANKLELVGQSLLALSSTKEEAANEQAESFILKTLRAIQDPIARQSVLSFYLQEQIARILRLAPSAINVQQPLTAFGLDSLMAIELKNEIESALAVELSMSTLLQGATIQELVSEFLEQLAEAKQKGASRQQDAPLLLPTSNEPFALSYNQQALWFLQQLAPDSAAYHVFFAARIRSRTERSFWKDAFDSLVRRHPSLRTTYHEEDGQPMQQVHEYLAPACEHVDASGWNLKQVNDYLTEASHRPFKLDQDSPLRITLLSRAEDEHFLLLTVHHIASDLWSLLVLMDELRAQEQASALPHSYATYVKWQRDMLGSAEGERLWRYWRDKLTAKTDQLPVLDLPTDYARPPIQTYHGASHAFKLDQTLSQQIKQLAQANSATLYMTLLAVFQTFLHRYSGQDDILVGSPMASRSRREFEPLVGHFVNTVVLRADLSQEPTFAEVLAQVRQTVLEALQHQDYPFQLLVEKLQPERDASRSPLFQVMFVLQKPHRLQAAAPFVLKEAGATLDMGNFQLESWPLEKRVAQFDLSLMMVETEEGLLASLEYNTDLFNAATIERMATHFETLLAGIVANPQEKVAHLPLLTETERHQMLVEWNSTQADFPTELGFARLFERQVERTPDAMAVVAGDQQLTYRELNDKANQLAHILLEQGVGPDTIVALLAERSLEFLTAMIALFKAGGAYLPLDPRWPVSRLRQVLEQSQTPLVLASLPFQSVLSDALETLAVAQQPNLLYFEELGGPQPNPSPNISSSKMDRRGAMRSASDLAYVIYTSGSTGSPKGVMIEQRGMVNHLYAKIEALSLAATDRIAQTAPQSFDISVWQFLAALLVGGQVHILGDEITHEPLRLLHEVENQQISVLEVVPSVLQMMLEEVAQDVKAKPALSDLRWLMPTGEALPPQLCHAWFTHYPSISMINAYGPTECSDDVTHYQMDEAPAKDVLHIPIGRPIPNMQLYILDAHLQPVPIGVTGELYVGGMGVGRGYLNDPERTAQAFVLSGEAPLLHAGQRLYKTGDKARYLPSGNIEFLGRLDHQVKIRGNRIELGEIEAVLAQHQAVQRAVVVTANGKGPQSKRLVAYVVPNKGDELGQSNNSSPLRHYLTKTLPDYMVPSAFVMLDSLPLTANGKINRRALPAPTSVLPSKEGMVGPRTPVEEQLIEIWREVLGLNQAEFGIHETFFELGGHSLLATQVVSRVRNALQIELPVRNLFEAPTVAQLAEQIEMSRQMGGHRTMSATRQKSIKEFIADLRMLDIKVWSEKGKLRYSAPKGAMTAARKRQLRQRKADLLAFLSKTNGYAPTTIQPVARDGDLPLSFAQQRIWFLEQLEGESATHNMPAALRLDGKLDIEALQNTMNEIVSRHEGLRTTFPVVNGVPHQAIAPDLRVPLPILELGLGPKSGLLSKEAQLAEVQRLARQEAKRLFDLVNGPLLRVKLLRLADEQHVLLITMHHIISDGWSIGVFVREWGALYKAYLEKAASPLQELAIQYLDFAHWQQKTLQGETLEKLLTYWGTQLADAPPLLELPTDYLRPAVQSLRGGRDLLKLEPELMERVKTLSHACGTTDFMTSLAVFGVLLSRMTGEEDLMIGCPIANRNRHEIEHLIGCFINTLVMRIDLSGNPTFLELLKQVKQTALDGFAHQDLPFEKLVEALQPTRNMSHAPLFQVMFVLQNTPIGELLLPGLKITELKSEHVTADFDLTLFMGNDDVGWSCTWEYSTDLFTRSTIQRMMGHFRQLLKAATENPSQRVQDLPLLTEQEQHQLLVEWNKSETALPADGLLCFHQLFEQQVEKTPDAVAARFEGQTLTYRDLNAQANQLAHLLVDKGVGPDVVVALLMERSLDFLIAVLAIFKAGGAYLPLNPHAPAERQAQVIKQSQTPLLLMEREFESVLSSPPSPPLTPPNISSSKMASSSKMDRGGTNSPSPIISSSKMASSSKMVGRGGRGVRALFIEELQEKISKNSEENLPPRCTPDDLAYVIYTSGSTGLPKGAMIEQKGMLNHLYAKIWDLSLTEKDRIAQTAPQSFDISVWQFLSALLVGGQVHIFKDEIAADPASLLEEVEQQAISILEVVPSLLRMMLKELDDMPEGSKPTLANLRWFIPTGEALPPPLCRQWFDYYPNVPMVNAYGPTECSDDVTHYVITEAPDERVVNMPIGRPVANMRLYILDAQLQPVPIGVAGELYVGGIGVGRGYLHDPDRTAKAFIPVEATSPLFLAGAEELGTRLYKTGDKARYLPDTQGAGSGSIEFLGRLDYQVKIRGFRIELGEIEAVLGSHANVGQVAVIVRDIQPAGKTLIAYVVLNQEDVTPNVLRRYLSDKLPDYMVPALFIILDAMPLTPNGKVNRRALQDKPLPEMNLSAEHIAPRNATEAKVASIWARVMEQEETQIGVLTNFFELGGHSLLATQIMSRVHKTFQLKLSLQKFFEQPTVAGLAELIERRQLVQQLQASSNGTGLSGERVEIEL